MRNFFRLFILLIFASGCSANAQKQTAEEMLRDTVKQKEIFQAISNDSTQMRQFMQYMMRNHKPMQMMAGHHQMMMNMMKEDTSMCRMMMGNMMDMMGNDSAMCKMMGKQMMGHQHMKGMMKDEMMCPMHEKMNMGEMKKEEMPHHHKK